MKLGLLLTDWVKQLLKNKPIQDDESGETAPAFIQRIPFIFQEALSIVKGVAWYILIGIAIGGLMHGFIPTGFFETYISKENPLAVPLAAFLGVPMYSNTAAILPIMQVLVEKGIPLGTIIAFSMAVVGYQYQKAYCLKKK